MPDTATIRAVFEQLAYGPAPESPAPALDGLARQAPATRLYLGGDWVSPRSGEDFETVNPDTGKPLIRVAQAAAADVDATVADARAAFGPRSALPGHARARYLYALARQV